MLNKFVIKSYQLLFRAVDLAFPDLAVRWAVRLFCTPQRYPKKQWESFPRLALDEREIYFESHNRLERSPACYVRYQWGRGPAVLLVHGWEGRASQMAGFIKPLMDAGFSVITFDAPAHGKAPGKRTNLPEMAEVIADIQKQTGEFFAIIAHSFGGVVAAFAIRGGVRTEKLITIGSPASMKYIFDDFEKKLMASSDLMERFALEIERIARMPVSEMSPERIAAGFSSPGLVIHDRNDKEVDLHQALRLHANWKRSRLMLTENQGHRRILNNERIIAAVLEFVTAEQESPVNTPFHQT
ncbi:MAG: alpha/beta hydrolase [Calditrichia bacterium]